MRTLFFIGQGLSLALLLYGITALAAPSDSLVQRYFRELQSLKADFEQRVFDEDSRLLQFSSGRMVMQKPGRFRWDYREPYEQIIVADGDRLWLYDTELEQVTVRRLDMALSATPLALLSGAAPIQETFTISPVSGSRDGLQWYELYPKEPQTDFKVLRIAFAEENLRALELEDMFNQRTRLNFNDLQRNVTIDPELLQFTPPSHVDVVGDVP